MPEATNAPIGSAFVNSYPNRLIAVTKPRLTTSATPAHVFIHSRVLTAKFWTEIVCPAGVATCAAVAKTKTSDIISKARMIKPHSPRVGTGGGGATAVNWSDTVKS